mmetsp:Transcript_11020/g.40757  ORF Transcript_11020/g.40757 Transcript_11020/m.40757 type:complete len:200 (-) Transcript_11020:381-980(-)
MIPLKNRTGSATSAKHSSQNASESTVPNAVPSALIPAAFAAKETATQGAVSRTTPVDAAIQHPNASPSARENMKTSHLFSGSFEAGTNSCFTTLPGSMSHRSMCFTTFPVVVSNTCVVPPAAASLGRHGKSRIHENLQLVVSSSFPSSHCVIFKSMLRIMPPRFPTFCLNLSTPLKLTKGSENSHSGSYAARSPKPLTK